MSKLFTSFGNPLKRKKDSITENHKIWLKELLMEASDEAFASARNEHLFALGAKTNKESKMHEQNADELRTYARLLSAIWIYVQEGDEF